MWVHWGDRSCAMEKSHRLHNNTERSSLQQDSNHVSKTSQQLEMKGYSKVCWLYAVDFLTFLMAEYKVILIN